MKYKEFPRPPLKKADIGWRKAGLRVQITVLLLVGMLGYACVQLVEDADLAERRIFVRYWSCLICGFLAIVVPHLLFPEAHLFLI